MTDTNVHTKTWAELERDEWREKAQAAYAKLEACEREREFHVGKLERTVAWLAVRLREAQESPQAADAVAGKGEVL